MFQVLYAPFRDVVFHTFGPSRGTPAVLAQVTKKGARVLICVEKGKEKKEIPMLREAAEWLNCSPSVEFKRLLVASTIERGYADLEKAKSK